MLLKFSSYWLKHNFAQIRSHYRKICFIEIALVFWIFWLVQKSAEVFWSLMIRTLDLFLLISAVKWSNHHPNQVKWTQARLHRRNAWCQCRSNFLSFFLSFPRSLFYNFLFIFYVQVPTNPGTTGNDPVKLWNLQTPNRHSSLTELSKQDLSSDGIGLTILDDPSKYRKYSNSKGMNVVVSDNFEPFQPVVPHVVKHATSA